jgi:hypothetical protein
MLSDNSLRSVSEVGKAERFDKETYGLWIRMTALFCTKNGAEFLGWSIVTPVNKVLDSWGGGVKSPPMRRKTHSAENDE